MGYYKIIVGTNIVGVASDANFRKYDAGHRMIFSCTVDEAEFIEANGVFYKDTWFKVTENYPYYTEANVVAIDNEEYNILEKAFETQEEIEIEPEEEPGASYEPPPEPDITVEFVKDVKIKEMSKACHDMIAAGFDVVLSDGLNHHFSLELEDQIKIQALALKAERGDEFLAWHPDGELCVFYSPNDILTIYGHLEYVQTYHTTYFNSLKQYVLSIEAIDELNNVYYGMEIPAEYQSEVYKYLRIRMGLAS